MHSVRPAEIEKIVVAAHLAVPGVEAGAAVASLVETERLDHRSHGAVEHEDALGGKLAQRRCLSRIGAVIGLRPLRLDEGFGLRLPFASGPQPQQMADRVDKIGAVHRVKMKIGDALIDEVEHLLRGDGGGDQLARRRIVVETVEAVGEPVRHRRAGARREILGLLEILHRQDAGHDRNVDAAGAYAIEITEIKAVLEKELGDRAVGAGVDLGLEHIDVGRDRGAVRMFFRIGGDRYFDVGDAFDAADKVGGIFIAAWMRRETLADRRQRIAAQRHDMAHAGAAHRRRSPRRPRRGWRRRR